MNNKAKAVACASTVLVLGLSGCGVTVEGSGNGEAASAEQLAMRLDDPWDQQIVQTKQVAEGNFKDGVYTGAGIGMDGKITATLLIQGNHITCVEMTQDGETQSVGGYEAIRSGKYAQMINAAQGSDIDTISGATITTKGVRDAVDNALSQARA